MLIDEPMVLFWRVLVADKKEPYISSQTPRSMNPGRFQWASISSKRHDSFMHFVKRAPEAKALSSNHISGEECQHVEASNVVSAVFKDHLRNLGVCSEAAHLAMCPSQSPGRVLP